MLDKRLCRRRGGGYQGIGDMTNGALEGMKISEWKDRIFDIWPFLIAIARSLGYRYSSNRQ